MIKNEKNDIYIYDLISDYLQTVHIKIFVYKKRHDYT